MGIQKEDFISFVLENYKYDNLPVAVIARLEQETDLIQINNQLDQVIKISQLSQYANKCNMPLILNGTANGSLVLYFLNISKVNPLPAHYRCGPCQHFEWADRQAFGIDLPERMCPNCNQPMIKDGFNIPIESIWYEEVGTLHFDFITTPIFIELAEKKLKDIYGWDRVCFSGSDSDCNASGCKKVEMSGFYILPTDKTINDYSDYQVDLNDGKRCLLFHNEAMEENIELINMQPSVEMEELKWLADTTDGFPTHYEISDGAA